MSVCSFKKREMKKGKFFKITFHIWSMYIKHCGGLTHDLCWLLYMMRTVDHIICILYLSFGIIIENFQGCAQGIQNLSKISSVYTFGFYSCWCLSLEVDFIWLCSKVLQSLEVVLWRFYSPGSSQATGQSKMVVWRVPRVCSRNLVPQFSKCIVHWFCSVILSFPTTP